MSQDNKEEKCNCEEMTCKQDCTKYHTCHVYWCEKCKPERYEKEEKVEVTEHQDGTIRANGIQIVPSPRIDWCGACKSEHGYDCPLDTPQTPSWEEGEDKNYIISMPRSFGRRTQQGLMLLEEIYRAEKYIVFDSIKSKVHIIPDEKLQELLSQAKQEGRREGIEEAILEIIYGCARYTNMHQDTDDVNVAVNTVRADVLSKLDKKRK